MYMNVIDNHNAEEWVNRFLDGETSCEEEAQLYRYFFREDLPAGLEHYRAMFAWYAAKLGTEKPADTGRRQTVMLRLWHCVSVAAAVAVIALVGLHVCLTSMQRIPDEYMCYEGSYMIVNGRMITDIPSIIPELVMAEKMLAMQHDEMEAEFGGESFGDYVVATAVDGIDDEAERETIRKVLSEN